MRKKITLQLPRAQIVPTAAPVAPLGRAQVQKPQESELSRIAQGFGNMIPSLVAYAEKRRDDEVDLVDAKVQGMSLDEVVELLDGDDLKDDLGIRFEASLVAAEGRIGQRLSEGFSLSSSTIIALGDPISLSSEQKAALVDGEIEGHINSLPPVASPFMQAGLRQGLASVRRSALADGQRRSAAQAEANLVLEIENEARDAIMAAGLSEDGSEVDLDGMLRTVSKGLPQQASAQRGGIVKGLAALAAQDSDKALELVEQLRANGTIEGEDVQSVKSQVLAIWNRDEQLRTFGKGVARSEAADAVDSFVLDVVEQGLSEATNHQELRQELTDNPDMSGRLTKMREQYSTLSDDEWRSILLRRLDAIPRENSRIQAQLDRNNKRLPDEVKESLMLTNGVQSKYDEIASVDWTYEQKVLADSLFERSQRQYSQRVNDMVRDRVTDARHLSSADRSELQRLTAIADTEAIEGLLVNAANAYRTPKDLWSYTAGEAARDQFYEAGAARLLADFAAQRDELGGDLEDFTLEDAKAEYARVVDERVSRFSPGWESASNEERERVLRQRVDQRVDLINDTEVDDWIKLHATSERNTRLNEDGSYSFGAEAADADAINSALGEYRTNFPRLGEQIEELVSPGMFTSPDIDSLRTTLSSPEFRQMLEESPGTREVVSTLLSRLPPQSLNDFLNDSIGSDIIEGGLPLRLAVPPLQGTSTPDVNMIFVDMLPRVLSRGPEGELSFSERALLERALPPGTDIEGLSYENLINKLKEQVGLEDANFEKALPGIIRAQASGAAWSRVDRDLRRRINDYKRNL